MCQLFLFFFVKYLVFFVFCFEVKSQDTLIQVILLDDIVISEENNGFLLMIL